MKHYVYLLYLCPYFTNLVQGKFRGDFNYKTKISVKIYKKEKKYFKNIENMNTKFTFPPAYLND